MEGIQRKTDAMLAQIQQMTNRVEGTLVARLPTESKFSGRKSGYSLGKGLPIFTIENPIEWDQKLGYGSLAQLFRGASLHTVVDIPMAVWMVTCLSTTKITS